jgi:protein farnesyltransferase/geranylgeranyltransferase type-1 subunit alpha
MNYFRAIILSNEISDRVYRLTFNIINYLPSNYNVWYIRRKCINKLNIDANEEINFLNKIIDGNEKVY